MRHLQIALALVLSVATLLAADVRILVKPNDDANETAVQNAFGAHGATQVTNISQINVRVLTLPEAASTNAVEALSHNPLFAFAEMDRSVEPDFIPNDPSYSGQWHLTKIQAPSAWNTTLGGTNIIIAICDTGVEATHPDLSANLVAGYNFYDNNSNTSDVYGHGTPVAGTAAEVGNNAVGSSGVTMNCRIMPLRITDTNGIALFSNMAAAITYAADHGARVANLSYIGSDSLTVQNAAQYLSSKGGLTVISAGNNGSFDTNSDNAFILTVSGTDQNDALLSFSVTGNNVDLSAPGTSILTTGTGATYTFGSGTSFSAPIVAGVAALVMSANPNLTGLQVQAILKNNADDLGSAGWDPSFGYGRVNAFRAVQAAIGYTGTITVTATQGCNWTASPDVTWITIINGATGTGNGTVTYGVAANPTSSTRTGRINVAGKVFFVTQTGIACNYAITPTSDTFSDSGGGGLITVNASDSICAWTATSAASWITVNPASGTGNGNVNYTVAATALASTRTATLTVAGQTFTVTQTGDTTAPVVSLTSPANASTISNIVNVSATATDLNMARVDFYRDAAVLIGTDTTTPYSLPFQTTNITDGAHTFYARGFDIAGNQGLSSTNSVTVANGSFVTTNSWAQKFGNTSADIGLAVATDSSANIIAAGAYQGSVNFGTGVFTNAGFEDIFIAKYSPMGVPQWAKHFGDTGRDRINSVIVDTNQDVLVTGFFTGAINFGGGILTSAGGLDIVMAKYSSAGSFIWAQRFGSTLDDAAYAVTVDGGGNVIITGGFQGTVNFGGTNLTASLGLDFFLAKYSAAGTHLWSRRAPASGSENGFALATDSSGDVIAAGSFTGSVDFGGGFLATAGQEDIFLVKFAASNGLYIWQQRFGSTASDKGLGVKVDSGNNIALTGYFSGTVDFGGTSISTPVGATDAFIAKYNSSGTNLWIKRFGAPIIATGYSIAIDSSNNIVAVGLFQNTATLDGGQTISSAGGSDVFVTKYSSAGVRAWTKSAGGTSSDVGYAVATDVAGYPVVTGSFSSTGSFNGTSLTSAGLSDIFLMKMLP